MSFRPGFPTLPSPTVTELYHTVAVSDVADCVRIDEVPALNKRYETYKDQVVFYVVYIEEAHPIDGWQMPVDVKENVLAELRHETTEFCDFWC